VAFATAWSSVENEHGWDQKPHLRNAHDQFWTEFPRSAPVLGQILPQSLIAFGRALSHKLVNGHLRVRQLQGRFVKEFPVIRVPLTTISCDCKLIMVPSAEVVE